MQGLWWRLEFPPQPPRQPGAQSRLIPAGDRRARSGPFNPTLDEAHWHYREDRESHHLGSKLSEAQSWLSRHLFNQPKVWHLTHTLSKSPRIYHGLPRNREDCMPHFRLQQCTLTIKLWQDWHSGIPSCIAVSTTTCWAWRPRSHAG